MVYINHNDHKALHSYEEEVLARIAIKDIPKNQQISKNELQRISGGSKGSDCLPDVDDGVLVAFIHGDIRMPIVIGSLWNGKDVPPVSSNSDTRDTKI